MCGERRKLSFDRYSLLGSSPRVRGTLCRARSTGRRARFIPACAGNAPRGCRTCPQVAVHPRVCGERIFSGTCPPRGNGSSPRVRGTLQQRTRSLEAIWFIPACAGNALARAHGFPGQPVHPRVCGERVCHGLFLRRHDGSSPRVRGTLPAIDPVGRRPRFIPACAGNAPTDDLDRRQATVHPRVCGERVVQDMAGLAQYRFIPACAGNAGTFLTCRRRATVHPRVCGERWPLAAIWPSA